MVPVFKNVMERSTAKSYCPFSVLSLVNKIFETLVNNRILDHLEKCGRYSDFQYGIRSSRSTADLLTVVSDRVAGAFNMSGTARAVAIDISKAFDRVCHAGHLYKLKSYGISGQILSRISSFLSNSLLRVVLDGKSSQDIQLMLEFLKGAFLILHFCCYTLMTFLMMLSAALSLSMLMILFPTLNVIRHLICGNN